MVLLLISICISYYFILVSVIAIYMYTSIQFFLLSILILCSNHSFIDITLTQEKAQL